MRINQNIMAFNAYRNLSTTNTAMGKSLEKLSSGFRINRAADDAAGLVISQNLRAQTSGLKVATRNAQDGISVVQTAEGALNEVHNLLNRMRDLAVQSSNTGSSDSVARNAAAQEVTQAISEISRISETTRFGNVSLFSGYSGVFQVGANADPNSQITVNIGTVSTGATGDYALDLAGDSVGRFGVSVAPAGLTLAGTAPTAATLVGGATTDTDFSVESVTFDLTVDGVTQAITLDADYGSALGVANAINTQFGANVATNAAGTLSITSSTTGSSSGVEIDNYTATNAAVADAGFADAIDAGTDFVAGTNTVALSIDGAGASTVNLNTYDLDSSGTLSGAELAAGLNTISGISASYLDGELSILSDTEGAGSSIALSTGVGAAGTALAGGTADTTTNGVASLVTSGSNAAITKIDDAIDSISSLRANLGAFQNRFESTIANLQVTTENLSASESRIRDTDVALEMVSFTRSNILMQAGTAMLAQANQLPQSVLRLLG
jgi:flagellin